MEQPLSTEQLLVEVDRLRHLVRSLLKDDAAVEDVLQETLIAALESHDTPKNSMRAWLSKVARNLTASRQRSSSRRLRREALAATPEAVASTWDQFQDRVVAQEVADAVHGLP